jgi:hypothetical protein
VVGQPALVNVFTPRGISDLAAQDPGARWDEAGRRVTGSEHADWRQSPRVVAVPLYDPGESRGNSIRLTRFIWIFIERMDQTGNVPAGRYVGAVRTVQLVE